MVTQGLAQLPAFQVPQDQLVIMPAAGQGLSIGRESHAPDFIRMPRQSLEQVSAGGLPQQDGIVRGATCQGLPIGGESQAVDMTIHLEVFLDLTAGDLPQGDTTIRAACQAEPIRGESQGKYPGIFSVEGAQFDKLNRIPQDNDVVFRTTGQDAPIR